MADNQAVINYLKVILGNDVEPNIVSYITSMQHEEDYEEFMENIIVKNNAAHKVSYSAIHDIIFSKKGKDSISKETKSVNQQPDQSYMSRKKDKKKFKDISLYQVKKKEKQGRTTCDCMGQEHEFMNNCVECGRIHCMDEGPGPCLFCGQMVTVRGAELYDLDSRKLKAMRPKQNKVFDDDNDYFKINSKKNTGNESKQKMVVALDFATRRVIEGSQEDAKIRQKLLENSMQHLKKVEEVYKSIQKQSEASSKHATRKQNIKANDELVDLLIQMRHKKPIEKEDLGVEDNVMPIIDYGTRVLDEDLLANTDHGLCLSLHQPLASLLVAGVKKLEGRSWPTTHRGRLWIAAAAKAPEEDEIDAAESFYREYYKDPSLKFPKEYPTSCLLGCVSVDDCLDQETCRKLYPNSEENNSPYVFVCSNPIILPIFYPISGKHKIYPLDKELHKCAKMALQHAKYVL